MSTEVLPLTEMPAISIDAKSIDLGYGVRAEDTIWCNQAIMRVSDLRDSDDEQFLADIISSIALGSPFAASKSKFNNYYGKGDVDKLDEIDVAIARYGENNLGEDIKMLESSAGTDPVWYKNKLYIRDGHEKKPQEVSGDQIAAVYSLFK
ncbi:hypothetical protein FNW02_20040 [Komarekiella sp. 'clone 1']|uniref:Uncharacterized protein n=1 Tax=Komarekiella delphini-convector SJRDD-AB1 TaxID=2593771 RepID=A0AA40SZS4_9NOST|nr:hypothetical protein [Komarekiella delphini-convector]MBD6618054.1 hypothetical protein [Komarekiella delphini-convector SJRDD-AB1]